MTHSRRDRVLLYTMLAFLFIIVILAISARGEGVFSGTNTFTTPGTLTIQSGVNLTGTWNFSAATVSGLTVGAGGVNGEMQWNNTGVLAGLPTITTDGTDVTTPASRFYLVDITDPTKKVRLNLTGIPTATSAEIYVTNNSTTVIGDTGAANNFLTAINPTTGVITKARPTIANLTDLSGTAKIVGSNQSAAGVTELTLGNNLSIAGNQINAATGGVSDGDKGDISVTGGGGTWTVDAQAISYPKIQNVTQNRILGRVSAGSGQVEELTGAQVTPLLSTFGDATAGLVPASGGGTTTYLRADHTFAAPPGSGTVTTTGTPFLNSLALFSGTTSITNLHNALGTFGFLKVGSDDLVYVESATNFRGSIGAGTVTSFSAGDATGLFTTSESNVTTTPSLSFNMTTANAHNYWGNNTGSAGAAGYHQIDYSELTGWVSPSSIYVGSKGLVGRESAGAGAGTTIQVATPLDISGGYLVVPDGNISRVKLADGMALSVVGRSANSVGDLGDIGATAGTNYVLRESGSSIGWGQVATGGIANSAVTLAKIQNAGVAARVLGSSDTGGNSPYSELRPLKNLTVSGTDINAGAYATGENQTGFSTDQYINGSRITMPAGSLTVGMMYHCLFEMSKTAAGTGNLNFTVRIGTAGTTADTAAIQIAPGVAGTANADIGIFEVWAYVRSSGVSTVVVGTPRITKNGTSTGLMNTGGQVIIGAASAGSSFNSSSATKIGMSFNGGTSFSGTVGFVQAELIEP